MEVLTEHTDPLTEENTTALLLSSYCVQSEFAAYFYFEFIYYTFFFFKQVTTVERSGTPRISYSTAQPLFGSSGGGTAEQNKGRAIRR